MPACNFLPMYQGERSASAVRKLQSMARPSTIWRRKSSDKEGAHARRCRLLPHQPTAAPAPARLAPKPKCERVSGGRAHTRRWWLRLLCAAPPCGLRRHRPHPPSAGRLHRHPTRSRRPAHQPVSRAVSWARQAFSGCHRSRAALGPDVLASSGNLGWAGRNQNIFQAIPHLSCICVAVCAVDNGEKMHSTASGSARQGNRQGPSIHMCVWST